MAWQPSIIVVDKKTERRLLFLLWLNSNKGTKREIGIKKSTRRPFQRASDSYPSNSPREYHPIESDPVQRLSPIRFWLAAAGLTSSSAPPQNRFLRPSARKYPAFFGSLL
jgi:hypothetical protein